MHQCINKHTLTKSHANGRSRPQHASIRRDLLTEADRREEICLAKGPNDLICGRELTRRITAKSTHTRSDTNACTRRPRLVLSCPLQRRFRSVVWVFQFFTALRPGTRARRTFLGRVRRLIRQSELNWCSWAPFASNKKLERAAASHECVFLFPHAAKHS